MANTNRLAKRYLKTLSETPEELHQYGFAPLLRYLAANSPLTSKIGYSVSPKQDCVRFGQTPLLHFHSSAFTKVMLAPTSGNYKVKNSYWGMLGINGPLPLHLTEYAIERNFRFKDSTFNEFLDIFNHRFISLFYRAWADGQPCVKRDRPDEDNFCGKLDAFSGEHAPKEDEFTPSNDVHQLVAGLFSHKNRSGKVLSQILCEYLKLNVSVDEFQGRWYSIPSAEKSLLGWHNSCLGKSSVIGERTYQRSANFTVNIGPVKYEQYIEILNNPQRFNSIKTLTQKTVGQEYEFGIAIFLSANQTRPSRLGSAKLGINSWCQDKSGHLRQHDPILVYSKAC